MKVSAKKRGAAKLAAEAIPIDIEPRCPGYMCPECKKDFKAGDRIVQAFICMGVFDDPVTGATEAASSPNFEVYHVNCKDPQLQGLDQPMSVSSNIIIP